MNLKWNIWTRKTHYWAAVILSLPAFVIFGSGLLLQVKKHVDWIQPRTQRGSSQTPALSFDRILEIARSVSKAEVRTWADIDRLDVQPARGIVKVQASNGWELQLDHASGVILQVAYRRSDLIESIHDGTYFLKSAKLWVFLPTGLGLLLLWGTGMYLFVLPFWARRKKRNKLPRHDRTKT